MMQLHPRFVERGMKALTARLVFRSYEACVRKHRLRQSKWYFDETPGPCVYASYLPANSLQQVVPTFVMLQVLFPCFTLNSQASL